MNESSARTFISILYTNNVDLDYPFSLPPGNRIIWRRSSPSATTRFKHYPNTCSLEKVTIEVHPEPYDLMHRQGKRIPLYYDWTDVKNYNFIWQGGGLLAYLPSVILHEMGHALGLGHTKNVFSDMGIVWDKLRFSYPAATGVLFPGADMLRGFRFLSGDNMKRVTLDGRQVTPNDFGISPYVRSGSLGDYSYDKVGRIEGWNKTSQRWRPLPAVFATNCVATAAECKVNRVRWGGAGANPTYNFSAAKYSLARGLRWFVAMEATGELNAVKSVPATVSIRVYDKADNQTPLLENLYSYTVRTKPSSYPLSVPLTSSMLSVAGSCRELLVYATMNPDHGSSESFFGNNQAYKQIRLCNP